MTIGQRFMSLADVYAYVTEVCGDSTKAQRDIELALINKELVVFAKRYRGINTPEPIALERHPIRALIWEASEIPWTSSLDPIRVRSPHSGPDQWIEITGPYAHASVVQHLWPMPRAPKSQPAPPALLGPQTPAPGSKPELLPTAPENGPSPPRKGVGGVAGDFDWEAYIIEASGHVVENGLPKARQDLYQHLWDKFGGKEGGPSLTQMREHIGPLYDRLKRAFGK